MRFCKIDIINPFNSGYWCISNFVKLKSDWIIDQGSHDRVLILAPTRLPWDNSFFFKYIGKIDIFKVLQTNIQGAHKLSLIPSINCLLLTVPWRYHYRYLYLMYALRVFLTSYTWLMISVCLYMYERALLERWVYVLCCVSCLSFFLLIYHSELLYLLVVSIAHAISHFLFL